jgi:cytoskeletal protein RodZ
MKPFDENFADNVRNAFDTYQEPVDEKAWEQMRTKIAREKKPRILWLSPFAAQAAAAALLLLAGGLLWMYFPDKISDKSEVSQVHVQQPYQQTYQQPYQPQTAPVKDSEFSHTILSETTTEINQPSEKLVAPLPVPDPVVMDNLNEWIAETQAVTELPASEPVLIPEPVDQPLALKPDDGFRITEFNYNQLSDYGDEYSGSSASSSLQFTAGPTVSYTHNQLAEGLGFAAGVLHEWRLSDAMSIAAGGVLTYSSFSFDPLHTPTGRSNQEMSIIPQDPSFDYPSGWNSENISYDFSNEYKIMAIDFPINAKFQLSHSRNNELYVSAGFSSLLYLQEQFTENRTFSSSGSYFDQATNSYRSVSSSKTNTDKETVDAFQRFDFARLLNFSFGYGLKWNNDAFVIEPFVKLPLGNMTSRNIQMGMGGVSLKYRWGSD